jgi:hypothetical protein
VSVEHPWSRCRTGPTNRSEDPHALDREPVLTFEERVVDPLGPNAKEAADGKLHGI